VNFYDLGLEIGLEGTGFGLESCNDNLSSPSNARKIIKLIIIIIIN